MKSLIKAIKKLLNSFEDGDWDNLGLLEEVKEVRRLLKQ